MLAEDNSKSSPLVFSIYPKISPHSLTFLYMLYAWSSIVQFIKIFLVLGIPKLHRILWMESQVLHTEESLPLFCCPHFLMQPSNALDFHCSLFCTTDLPQPVLLSDDIQSQTQDFYLPLLKSLSFPENSSKERVNDIQCFPISCIADHLIIESY